MYQYYVYLISIHQTGRKTKTTSKRKHLGSNNIWFPQNMTCFSNPLRSTLTYRGSRCHQSFCCGRVGWLGPELRIRRCFFSWQGGNSKERCIHIPPKRVSAGNSIFSQLAFNGDMSDMISFWEGKQTKIATFLLVHLNRKPQI